jgi:5-methylcytosine-specific restriction endonuclease McrA
MLQTQGELTAAFTEAMKGIHAQSASLKPPFHAPEFIRMVHEHGGKETADRLLAAGNVSSGFTRLWMRDKKLLTLSMEYLVLQDPWRFLFTDQQLHKARQRLTDVGCSLPPCDALWQELPSFVRQLTTQIDERNQPDNARLGAFRRGWADGLKHDVVYTSDAMQRLTWQNLGNRLAKKFGDPGQATIEVVFEHLSTLWHRHEPEPDLSPTADPEEFQRRVEYLRGKNKGKRPPPEGSRRPERVRASLVTESIKRDPRVADWVLGEAAGVCELCRQSAPFLKASSEPYLEVHHPVLLAAGGPDTPDNVVALCPNCHRRCHHAQDRDQATRLLYELVARLKVLESHADASP